MFYKNLFSQRDAPEKIIAKYADTKVIHKFKYLGEMIKANGIEKEAHEIRTRKRIRVF